MVQIDPGKSRALFKFFYIDTDERAAAARLHGAVVARAREPAFYLDHGVPDTIDGRFEMIALHAFAILDRLGREGEPMQGLAQALLDRIGEDLAMNLREMGVGDLGVGRRIKVMGEALFGRGNAYREALADAGDDAVAAALRRNLYGTVPLVDDRHVAGMAAYLRALVSGVGSLDAGLLRRGEITWPGLPADDAAPGISDRDASRQHA